MRTTWDGIFAIGGGIVLTTGSALSYVLPAWRIDYGAAEGSAALLIVGIGLLLMAFSVALFLRMEGDDVVVLWAGAGLLVALLVAGTGFAAAPALAFGGLVLMAAGSAGTVALTVVTAIAGWIRRRIPDVPAALLVGGSVSLLLAAMAPASQQALWVIPYGMAWIVFGASRPAARPAATRCPSKGP